MLDDYDDFLIKPTDEMSPHVLQIPKGIVFPTGEQQNCVLSNFTGQLKTMYVDNLAKIDNVVKKAIAELVKPACQQVALYGSWTLTNEWLWPHVAASDTTPNKRGYVRAMEDGFALIPNSFSFLFQFAISTSVSQVSQSSQSVKSVSLVKSV